MRKVLKSSNEVFHFWANKVQSEGKAGAVFFDGEYVFSYDRHFAIARHLPNRTVAFTTRGYSNTTAKHISQARSAASHLTRVFCNDPADSAATNMRHAQAQIVAALEASRTTRRIQQKTRLPV